MNNLNKNILLGTAIGDALGVPVEFEHRQELEKNPVVGMREYGTHNQPKGTWSDDSSLALCLAESLCNGYNLNDIADKFIRWYYDGYCTPYGRVFDVGVTTARAISYLQSGCKPELAGMDRERDNGNGSLMRILPLIPYIINMEEEDRFRIIGEVSSLTHRHPRSILACISLCEFAIQYINLQSIEKAYQTMQQTMLQLLKKEMFIEEDIPFKRLVGLSYEEFKNIELKDIRSTGYVIDTLEASLWCIFNTTSYKDAVLKAVNLGDDTDTVGAITGGLAGIIYGYDTIPSKWIDTLARKDDIIGLGEKLDSIYGGVEQSF
ncbi:ADP-ribosylglycohydrolase family protein [Butyricimonas virosa]|uniref:ADP-ribosylglycohydrolase family protein n=1 Tax=Butyricimonas virosa TaxID=544645 RepID=A0ABX7H729_9BACT|nr:ADP-ribosylglycohydrolase family protein [Butyricimonas virosa]QRO50681.1 ADP-ribosylglycohydrolase family protein [Butyricimonas virosa]UWO48608.1 ADP-ribosylglycohydrolase family protein [Butyricimonas virosa]